MPSNLSLVLAPSEEALAELDMESFESEEGKARLELILSYHVLMTVLPSTLIPEGSSTVPTLFQVTPVSILKSGPSVELNNGAARFLEMDILANNGIIHLIDNVLEISDTWQPTFSPTMLPTIEETPSPVAKGTTDPPNPATFTTAPTTTMVPSSVPTTRVTLPDVAIISTEAPTSVPTFNSGVGAFHVVFPCVGVLLVCCMLL